MSWVQDNCARLIQASSASNDKDDGRGRIFILRILLVADKQTVQYSTLASPLQVTWIRLNMPVVRKQLSEPSYNSRPLVVGLPKVKDSKDRRELCACAAVSMRPDAMDWFRGTFHRCCKWTKDIGQSAIMVSVMLSCDAASPILRSCILLLGVRSLFVKP